MSSPTPRSTAPAELATPSEGGEAAERDRVERALRESEALHRSLFTLAPSGVVLLDLEGRILAFNDQAHEQRGYTREEFARLSVADLVDGVREEEVRARIRSVAAAGQGEFEIRHRTKSGEIRHVLVRSRSVESGGETRLLAVWQDITDRKNAEQALRRSEAFYRAVLEGSVDFVTVLDSEGRHKFVGSGASAVVGWTEQELVAQQPFECVHPEDRERVVARFQELRAEPGRTTRVTYRFRHKDGSWRTLDTTARNLLDDPIVQGVVVNRRDVTEQQQLADELQRARRLESIGRLAGGVAHDFNNLLTVILSCAEALQADLANGSSVSPVDVAEIGAAGAKARDLARQLLAFARRQVIAPVPLDVNAIVSASEKLLRRMVGRNVRLATTLQLDLWSVRCDPGQLEQVIFNLAANARDAMPGGGTLAIETANVDLDGDQAERAGPYVRLAVRDSGVGMPPEVKAHIFEPFFTTKDPGKGTGLGLATVYGIVKQSGGEVRVSSEVGRGTLFEIFFPRTLEVAAAPAARPLATAARGTETVLLVEDDRQVRDTTVRSLRAGGYQVLVAESGNEALHMPPDDLRRASLLITDMVMPGIDGRALADALRGRYPALPVLFVSGYTQDAITERERLDPASNFLPKPFTPSSLLTRVRSILDAR